MRRSDRATPGRRFGSPYVMQVSRDVLYEDLQKLMLKEMAAAVRPDVLSSAQEVSLLSTSGRCFTSGLEMFRKDMSGILCQVWAN